MNKIKIRHVRADDLPSVSEIFEADHVVAGTMRLPYQSTATVAARIADQAGAFKLVAEIGNHVAGFCELLTYPDLPRHRHAGEVNLVATHPAHRGKGVGQAMLGALLDLSDRWLGLERLDLKVWVTNAAAIALYEANGFSAEGRLANYVFIDGAYSDALVMARLRPGTA